METVRQVEFLLAEVRREAQRIHERRSQEYLERLEAFVNELLRQPLRWYWRQDVAEYLIMAELDGYRLQPDSVRVLEGWIEEWATHLGRLPAESELGSGSGFDFLPKGESPSREIGRESPPTAPLHPPSSTMPPADPRPAPLQPSVPANWPRLTPEERERNERSLGLPWWYPIKPIGAQDHIWESLLEEPAREARKRLLSFFLQLAVEGRMGQHFGRNPPESAFERLLAQQQNVQRAYDDYLQARTKIERVWIAYLKTARVFAGIHVIALKEKIDRSLPTGVQGIASPFDGDLKATITQGNQAQAAALHNVESTYTALVWTDRLIQVIEVLTLAGAIKAGFTIAVEQAVAEGVSVGVARSRALAVALTEIAVSVGSGAVVAAVVPEILKQAGLDDTEITAGLAVFAAVSGLVGLRGAKRQSTTPSARTRGNRGVWDLKWPHGRNIIHERLGQNLPWSFPGVDKFNQRTGVVGSIKSLDLMAKRFKRLSEIGRVGRGYIDEVADFPGAKFADVTILPHEIRVRELELAIPPGATAAQRLELDGLRRYAEQKSVILKLVVIPW